MLEIKVQCDCGQRYKFDVEPQNGRMPFAVNCPICGLEGTAKANEILRQVLPASAVQTSPPPGLRLTRVAQAPSSPAPLAGNAPTTSSAPPSPLAARAVSGVQRANAVPQRKPSFALGLLGALLGALVGSAIYFLVFKYSGFQFKLLAVGVGFLTGYAAELLGRKEGSKELGMIAAALALAGIVSAQYLLARSWWNEGMASRENSSSYEARVAEARKVVAAIPTGSDQEIRAYLAREDIEPGEKPDLQSVAAEDIKEFRDSMLLEMQNLASGKTTKEEYQKKLQAESAANQLDKDVEEGTFKAVFLLLFLSKVNLISLCASAGLAFKLCSNA